MVVTADTAEDVTALPHVTFTVRGACRIPLQGRENRLVTCPRPQQAHLPLKTGPVENTTMLLSRRQQV